MYTLFEWAKALNINSDRARQWLNKGYIGVSKPAPGQGKAAEFSTDNIIEIMAFKRLLDFGMTRPAAAMVLREVAGWNVLGARFVRLSFLPDSTVKTDFLQPGDNLDAAMVEGASLSLTVDIDRIAFEVRAALPKGPG